MFPKHSLNKTKLVLSRTGLHHSHKAWFGNSHTCIQYCSVNVDNNVGEIYLNTPSSIFVTLNVMQWTVTPQSKYGI